MISQDHVNERSFDFICGTSSFRVTTLSGLMAAVTMVVRYVLNWSRDLEATLMAL